MEDAELVVLKLGGGEALAAHQGLASLVVGGGGLEVRLGHLYVVAEDLVVAHLQCLDAGALPLPVLEVGQELAGVAGGGPEGVQFLGEAGPNDGLGGRLVGDGTGDELRRVPAGVEAADEIFVDAALPLHRHRIVVQRPLEVRDELQAAAQGH